MRDMATMLRSAGVRSSQDEGETFFAIADIKERFPEHKIDIDKIRAVKFGETEDVGVRAEDVHPMTDWDKLIIKTLNFKDKLK